jgi:hypothetical protein
MRLTSKYLHPVVRRILGGPTSIAIGTAKPRNRGDGRELERVLGRDDLTRAG